MAKQGKREKQETIYVVNSDVVQDMFHPYAFFVAYKNAKNLFYCESHPLYMEEDQKSYVVGAGTPMDHEVVNELAGMMRGKQKQIMQSSTTSLIPENMLFSNQTVGRQVVAWWRPPETRMIKFDKGHPLKSGPRRIPALFYVYCNDEMYVYAMKGNLRPLPTTEIYHAPFYNVYDDGRICMGTVRKKMLSRQYFDNLMVAWETKFWTSIFTTEAHGKKASVELEKLWSNIDKPFDEKVLIRRKGTVQTVLEGLL